MYNIYNVETGKIRIQVSSASLAASNIGEGEGCLIALCDPDRSVVVDNSIQDAEPPPREGMDSYARRLRKVRLDKSDWTQVLDNQLTEEEKANWASYRQALRDFPQTVADAGATKEEEVYALLPVYAP